MPNLFLLSHSAISASLFALQIQIRTRVMVLGVPSENDVQLLGGMVLSRCWWIQQFLGQILGINEAKGQRE